MKWTGGHGSLLLGSRVIKRSISSNTAPRFSRGGLRVVDSTRFRPACFGAIQGFVGSLNDLLGYVGLGRPARRLQCLRLLDKGSSAVW